MPMGSAEGACWITYNGEIYNTSELRHDLLGRGCVFRSHSDTEVILRGYKTWGLDSRAGDRHSYLVLAAARARGHACP